MNIKDNVDKPVEDKDYCKSCSMEERFNKIGDTQKIDDVNKFFNTATIDMPKINFDYKKKPVYEFVKRIFDIFLSGLALVILSPLFIITTIIIKFQDGGKVFFIQKRVGRNGKKFNMIKFRSMCPDAEEEIVKLLDKNEATGPMFKIKNDPRVTKFGKFIRKTSIDELPQLFNIFSGSMSIVGPRPALPREANLYTEYQKQRFSVKPGLTCIWQVSGRSNVSFEQQVAMDREYIRRRNLLLDVVLIIKTIPAVIKHDGAV